MDVNIQLNVGDILLMKDGAAMGKLAFVDNLPEPACLNSHLLLFRPLAKNHGPTYDPQFMFYFMLARQFQDYVKMNGTGATFLGVSQEALGNYKICLPPIEEQKTIAKYLVNETASQDRALAQVEYEIDLLREYGTRLISDVVTGKLDVREAGANLPDEAPPEITGPDTDLTDEPEAEEAVA
jgi:type I restriction enzyme S subunit